MREPAPASGAEPDPADRRRNLVTLTTAGRSALRRLDTLADEAADALFAPLHPDERTAFVDMLDRIVRSADGTAYGADR